MAESLKPTLSEKEFCATVGISRKTAWLERKAGRLPHCRIGGKIKYLPRHIDEFLQACERKAVKQ